MGKEVDERRGGGPLIDNFLGEEGFDNGYCEIGGM
jgi:hypothetical protein